MNYHRNDPKSTSSQFGNKTKKNVTNKPKIPMGNFRNATSTNDVPTFRSVPMFEPLRPGKLQTIPTIEKPHMLRSQSTETTAAFTCDSLCSEQNFFFSDFSWDVKFSVDELPPLPMYVDVKFCVSVEATPSAIAGRIERLLYELSAVPKYSCDETKVCVYVTNRDHIEYVVSMFKGKPIVNGCDKNATGEHAEFVTVEIQKRRGSGRSFHEEAKSILESVAQSQGSEDTTSVYMKSSTGDKRIVDMCPPPIPASFLSKYSDKLRSDGLCTVTNPELSIQISDKSIESVSDMISNAADLDEILFALEDIEFLTNDNKACSRVASQAVRRLRQSDKVMLKIFDLIENPAFKSSSELSQDTMVRDFSRSRRLALETLVNVLSIDSKEQEAGRCPIVTENDERTTVGNILRVLKKELNQAEYSPHHAHLAGKCIGLLVDSSHVAKEIAVSMNILNAINHSCAVGQSCHSMLETEAEQLRSRFT